MALSSASGQLWLHGKIYSIFSKAKSEKLNFFFFYVNKRHIWHRLSDSLSRKVNSKLNLQCCCLPSRSATTNNRVIGQKKGQEWNTQYKNKSKPNVIIYILEVKSSTCISSTQTKMHLSHFFFPNLRNWFQTDTN